MQSVQITPKAGTDVALIEFNIVGVGKCQLPVLGQKNTPFGITSGFGMFQNATSDEQKLAAWAMLIQAMSDLFPNTVRVLSRLDGDDVRQVFQQWGELSAGYDPKATSSPQSSTGTDQP